MGKRSARRHRSARVEGGVTETPRPRAPEVYDKTPEHYFVDWEAHVFGFGYGTGELPVLDALHGFMSTIEGRSYDYLHVEARLGQAVAWLLINVLCHADVLEYGTSPRYGWLTPHGERLRDFVLARTPDDLTELVCTRDCDDDICYPDACNCGPEGYDALRRCPNPFWHVRPLRT